MIPDRYNPPPGYQDGLTWPLWPTPPGPLPTATPLATGPSGTSGVVSAAHVAPQDDPDGSCHDIHCIQHVVVIVMENQSFDRLFGTFQTSSGTPVAGFPITTGGAISPAVCLPDPRQTTVPPGATPLPPQCPYHLPVTVTPPGPAQNDNPHDPTAAAIDLTGVPGPAGTPTPLTGYLASAWIYCQLPNSVTQDYAAQNPACRTPVPNASPTPFDVMRYLDASDIPTYDYYARYYTLQDHLFAPQASYSLPAHLALVSNWSATCPISGTPIAPDPAQSCQNDPANPQSITQPGPNMTPTPQPYPKYAWTDLTYLLDHNQVDAFGDHVPTGQGTPAPVSWRYYVADKTTEYCPQFTDPCQPQALDASYNGTMEYWNNLPFFTTVHFDGTPGPGTPTPMPNAIGQVGNIQFHHQFYQDAYLGQLPQVSWIVPGLAESDHPPANMIAGQGFVQSLLLFIMNGGYQQLQWKHTAVFLLWDDWGGYYDHIAPTKVDQNGYGLRVPGIVISPYAKHCAVDSQPMSFDAINKFIEDDFLGSQRLNPATDGRPDPRATYQPISREVLPLGSDLANDFNFARLVFPTPAATPFATPALGTPLPTPPASWCSSP